MSKQAKTLTAAELRRALDYVATRRHAARNRAMLMSMYLAGLRVGECAALTYGDVVDSEGAVRDEIRLTPEQTKGRHARVVFVSERLRKELALYVKSHPSADPTRRLFYTQKRGVTGFTANTLCQHFFYLFRRAGIEGATSHSPRRTFITNLAERVAGAQSTMIERGRQLLDTTRKLGIAHTLIAADQRRTLRHLAGHEREQVGEIETASHIHGRFFIGLGFHWA